MTIATIAPLAPFLSLGVTILLVLFAIAFYRNHLLTAWLSLAGVTLSALMLWLSWNSAPLNVTPLLRIDQMGLIWFALLLFATLVVIVISYIYLSRLSVQREEYYLLLLLAVLGGGILTVSNHFASLFLGLEILSISLYALIGYLRDREHSIEAAIKYLILAAASAAFLLFGIALIYVNEGTLQFDLLNFQNLTASLAQNILLLVGFGMLLVGIGYKLAIVPFHMWAPDVYQGAPAPVAGFIATVSKAAVFAVLLRLSQASGYLTVPVLTLILGIIAALSMLLGNLLALLQDNVKRILAYSSIANLGYLLVAFLAFSTMAVVAATFYFTAYTVTILAAFFVVSVMSRAGEDAESIQDYNGLYWKRPWLAALFTIALMSLIGMPLTAGFMGKFFILTAGTGSALWVLVFILVVGSAISLYYYLRIIVAMFQPLQGAASPLPQLAASQRLSGGLVIGLLFLVLLWLGLYPSGVIRLIQSAVNGMG